MSNIAVAVAYTINRIGSVLGKIPQEMLIEE